MKFISEGESIIKTNKQQEPPKAMASITEKMCVLNTRGVVSDVKLSEFNEVAKISESVAEQLFHADQTDGNPSYNDEYEKIIKVIEQEQKIKNIYYTLYEPKEDKDNECINQLRDILEKLSGLEPIEKVDADGNETSKRPSLMASLKATAPYLLELVLKDKSEKEQAFKMKLEAQKSPKKKAGNGKGSTKTRWVEGETGTTTWVNTEDTAEGKDNKYWFKGDGDITFKKPTYVSPDKKTRRMGYKAVKSARYLGGEKSKPDDAKCNGTIIWDRAVASKAIGMYMSPAKFRARCDGSKTDGNYCSKCAKKPIDFFNDTYKFGAKSDGGKNGLNGVSYCEFITDYLVYHNQADIKTDDSEIDESSSSDDENQ